MGRLTDEQINDLSHNFKRSSRIILGLPEDDAAIEVQLVTLEIAEACASFLEALALSTEIYCLAYISIAKQGNITDNKLTAICNAITEEKIILSRMLIGLLKWEPCVHF